MEKFDMSRHKFDYFAQKTVQYLPIRFPRPLEINPEMEPARGYTWHRYHDPWESVSRPFDEWLLAWN